ncbi:hypothetical protein LE190_14960 [Massilia oculi]|uniref:Lipoprotein n=1 Tax=Massilia hydrophila TaxID=3044279 RepID=A0ABS7YBY9_9BURK|nr:hypothetical protein [Massilia oculi]MCA1857215.1 hypothetical protein [Massilia oculi]
MRTPSFLFIAPLATLLAGCVNDTASYRIAGSDHSLTLRVVQDAFWSKQASLRLTATRLPECQRQFALGEVALAGMEVELFESGPNVYTLRAGEDAWQVETASCSERDAPEADAVGGQALGVFHLDAQGKLVFEAAGTASAET